MQYVRRLDEAATSDFGLPGFEAAFLAQIESVTALASLVAPGCCGPGLHFHTSDQIFFVLEGTAQIQLGDEVRSVAAGSLVFVPAGVAHCSWNDSAEPERHLELLVPSVRAGLPLMTPSRRRPRRPARRLRRSWLRSITTRSPLATAGSVCRPSLTRPPE